MPVLSPGMSITLNELAHVDNAFEGHRGRPGQRGGSLPRSAGSYSGGDTGSDYSSNPPPIHREHRPYRGQSYSSTPSYIGSSEVDRRIAAGLESDNPEIRVRAKAAKAQRELLHTLPPPLSVAQTEQLKREATNPLSKVPEMKEGESFTDHALRSFVYAMESLDKPGRIVRGALGGRAREIGNIIPFSDYLGITKAEQAVSGRDLLQKIGIVGPNVEGFDAGDVAGFIVDAFTDPLMYVGGIGAISRSAKVAKVSAKTLNPKVVQTIATAAEALSKKTTRAALRKGVSPSSAKRAGTIAAKKYTVEATEAAIKRAKSRAKAAKPVKMGVPDSVKAKAAKAKGEAAAAAARKAVSSGRVGGTPAAAAMMLLEAASKLPIAGEMLRRVRKYVGRKAGIVTARVRETPVNPVVKVLGKEIKTGVKKPTTIGALVGKVNRATVGHPQLKKTRRQLQEVTKYLNQAHTAGKTFLEASGIADHEKLNKAAKKAATTNSLATLVANFSGKVRREKWKGKEYIVAPLSLIVEGVLNGSKGPLHYPMSEIKQNFSAWNGTPIVINHPTDKNGRPLRAQGNTEVLAKSIGVVRNASIKHPKLVAEGWFDVEKTKEIEPRVFNALSQGKPVELSTGLHTDNEPATNGAHWNGRSYTHVARNYRPDHLAILPDQVGACSINDGCGVLVNAAHALEVPGKATAGTTSKRPKAMRTRGITSSPVAIVKTPTPAKVRVPKVSLKKPKVSKPSKKPVVMNEDEEMMADDGMEEMVENEWSDEARAASLAVRRGQMFAKEQNVKHDPEHHAKLAASYHRKAFQARRGSGLLNKPDEIAATHYDAMAKLHEEKHADPAYHKKEAFYHKQAELEQQDFQKKAPGHYLKKLTSAGFRGGVGGVAGSIGGSLAGQLVGKYAGRTIGSVLGSTTVGTLGGLAGATIGGLVGGGPIGAAVGGVAGSTLGRASGRIIGSLSGAALSHPAGRAAGAALGRAASVVGKIGSPSSAALARGVGEKLGATAGSVVGSISGGVTGSALGASSGYRKAKEKIATRYQEKVAEERSKSDYHQMILDGLPKESVRRITQNSDDIVENEETAKLDTAVEIACVTNEWSDEARAAAAEARKRKFSKEANFSHVPQHHTALAASYRKKAEDARKGGFLRKPSEETAMHHEEMAKLHESKEKDPAYHKSELDYHKKQEVERKGYGTYVKRLLGHGAVGTIGGGLVGGAIGALATGGPGAPLGAAIGSEIGGVIGAEHGFRKASNDLRDRAKQSASYHEKSLQGIRPKLRKPKVGAANLS